jgi:hypothetical protein
MSHIYRYGSYLRTTAHISRQWLISTDTTHISRQRLVIRSSPRSLTDLYVQAAYAAEPVEHGDRDQAILSLQGMRGLLAATETPGG